MESPAPTKLKNLATTPCRKIKVNNGIRHILHLPSEQWIITWSRDGSFRVWNLERGTQFAEEWEDKDGEVEAMALSPSGKTIATGSDDGTVKLRNVDTGKVTKTLTGHKARVHSVCWSPDGKRVVSGCWDGTFRIWDIQSGETIIGPIKAMGDVQIQTVCYSPDGKMIAISLYTVLKIWDANTGELLKRIDDVSSSCLAWTSDGKTLLVGGWRIRKFDTATWTAILDGGENFVDTISLSPNKRILASTSYFDKTAELWNLETNQLIGTPLHHEDFVNSATFSADGKFFITSCPDGYIYTWDISAIVKEAGLPSDIADATPRSAPKMKGARRMSTDALRAVNLRTRLSQSNGPHNRPTPAPSQRTLDPFSSFWRRFKPHEATEPDSRPQSHPRSWTRSLVSGTLRRRHGSDIELQEPPMVEVPCTAGKPMNYHAIGMPAASSSQPPNAHTTQQPSGAAQSTPPSSQLPPPIATTSILFAVAGTTGATGTPLRRHIFGTGFYARFVGWICCMPIQNADGHH